MTNLRMETIMDDLKDMFENDFGGYPENINADNEFNNKEFIDYFTSKEHISGSLFPINRIRIRSLKDIGAH